MIERNKTGPLDRRYEHSQTMECNHNDAHPINLKSLKTYNEQSIRDCPT